MSLKIISHFATSLALRPDGDEVRATLAEILFDHRADLWPISTEGVTRDWIAGHVDEILAVCERLFGEALRVEAQEFLDRTAWLPELLESLDEPVPHDG